MAPIAVAIMTDPHVNLGDFHRPGRRQGGHGHAESRDSQHPKHQFFHCVLQWKPLKNRRAGTLFLSESRNVAAEGTGASSAGRFAMMIPPKGLPKTIKGRCGRPVSPAIHSGQISVGPPRMPDAVLDGTGAPIA
jgi:hypothetical protein